MTQASGEKRWWGLAAVLALGLALLSGVARAESSPAAWAFDLLARVEQWQSAGPLDFLPSPDSLPSPLGGEGLGVRGVQAGYGHLPMHFEPNLGQTADEVKFVARGPGYTLFLTTDEAVLALRPSRPASDRADPRHQRRPFDLEAIAHEAAPAVPGAVIRTRLEGATRNPAPQPEGLEKQPGISNYFLGNDPAKWRTHVPHYQRVRYPNVYPGIDVVYYGNPQRLEYDFIVAPGADPAAIQLAISGAEQATVNAEGDLVLKVPGGELVQQAPKIYQVIDGRQQAVAGRYVLLPARQNGETGIALVRTEETPATDHIVGFQVANYEVGRPLVIDPALVYSTYLGGSGIENDGGIPYGQGYALTGSGIAVDGSGNAYVTGYTTSTDFPKKNAKYPNLWGPTDAFVFKLSSDGQTVLYSTYLGGSSFDGGGGIAVDRSGNAYVTGETGSTDFPKKNAKYPNLWGPTDAFVFKLSSDGQTVLYSTYLGGSSADQGDGIAVDGSGNAYVAGTTLSTDFPKVNAKYRNLWGLNDAFIFKLSSDGQTVLYSTYLGGSGLDFGFGIAVDGSSNAYVTGWTHSTDFPKVNAKYPNLGGPNDAFVFKLSPNGQKVIYSTYLGGNDYDIGHSISVDGSGNAYVTGQTESSDFPTINAKYPNLGGPADAFVFKLSSDGQTVRYSTYLGGYGYDGGTGGITVDGSGNAYVTGIAWGAGFPAVNTICSDPSVCLGNSGDAFVLKLSGDGQTLHYSTYLGGNGSDAGSGIAVDRSGNAYVTGWTQSSDFPKVKANYPNLRGSRDAFVAKISDSGGGGSSVTLTLDVLDGQDFRSGANISTDPYLLGDLGRNKGMVGAATDGEARLVLRARTNQPGSVTFGIPAGDGRLIHYQGTSSGGSVTVQTVPVNGKHMAFAIYKAPEQFPRAGHAEDESVVQRQTTLSLNASGVTSNHILILKRPPVVLIHGLWADQTAWWDFEPKLKEKIEELYVYKSNYDNAAHFATNGRVPKAFISNAIEQYRKLGLAAVQADVFGHSMGGVLARRWAADPAYYKIDSSYQIGDINKLITIDSPHYGSPLGNIAFDNLSAHPKLGPISHKFGKPIDEGAIEDLQTDSDEIKNLNATATDIPVHAIVGDYQFSGTNMPDFPGTIGSKLWWWLDFFGVDTTRATNFPNGTDGIVGVKSQEAGLQNPQTTTENRIHTNEKDDNLNGCLETDAVANDAKDLLNAAPTDSVFHDGFPTASPPFPQSIPQRSKVYAQAMAAGGLRITTPAEGTVVTPGQSVQVTVEPDAGVVPVRVVLGSSETMQTLDAAPFQFTLIIPNDVVGPFAIAAVGKDAAKNLYDAELTLQVQPQSVLQGLGPDPVDFYFSEIGVTQLVTVQGYYADDGVRDLTAAATGTTYQSSDSSVVTVDADGRLTAQSNGTATITATHGEVSAYVTVRVEAETDLAISQTDAPDPIGADGLVTYTLTVRNQGTQRALDMQVFNTLPTGATLVQATGADWTCSEAGGVVSCLRDALDAGAAATISLEINAPLPCGVITNQATVNASTQDGSVDNNVSLVTTSCPVQTQTYTLTVTSAGTGSGTVGGGGNYAAGDTANLTATPAAGSTFAGWSPSPCTASFIMPANDLTCTATFTAVPPTYLLTVAKAGTGSGTVVGGGNYTAGATVTLIATANAGSTFTGWSPSPCAASFTMPANALTCTATFTPGLLLAGLASNGSIWYTTNLSTWTQVPGGLGQLEVGDLNGDGKADLAGLASNGSIWYTTDRSTWTQIPGGLAQLRVGELNGDGKADLVGLASDGSIWYTTNRSTWTRILGALSRIVVGDFDGDGKADDLAGVASDGSIWYTTNLTWTRIPGALSQIAVGDFDSDGKADDLAGVASDGSIWYTTNLSTWTRIPGALSRLVAGDFGGDGKADLAGVASDGSIWYTTNLSAWTRIPGALSRLVVGNFGGDGRDDLAGLASNGTIWYTTDRATWTNIPGQLNRLAGDD
ncbi:MAG: SBBP repeat-containing protein [Candidatus Contendobacter sp.]